MEIHYGVKQREPEWYELRRGVFTASNANKIITPTGALSKSSEKHINKLLAEKAGYPDKPPKPTDDMQWGIDH